MFLKGDLSDQKTPKHSGLCIITARFSLRKYMSFYTLLSNVCVTQYPRLETVQSHGQGQPQITVRINSAGSMFTLLV